MTGITSESAEQIEQDSQGPLGSVRFAGSLQPGDITLFDDGTVAIDQKPISEWDPDTVALLNGYGFEVPDAWRVAPDECQTRTRRPARFFRVPWWRRAAGADLDEVRRVAASRIWLDPACRRLLGDELEFFELPMVDLAFDYLVMAR